MAKHCPGGYIDGAGKDSFDCTPKCNWHVFYGRKGEKRLGMCVWVKIADLMELHFLEMV